MFETVRTIKILASVSLNAKCYYCLKGAQVQPDILDGSATISLFAPDLQGRYKEDDELSIFHADRHHITLRTIADSACRMAQVHLIQHLLFMAHKSTAPSVLSDI